MRGPGVPCCADVSRCAIRGPGAPHRAMRGLGAPSVPRDAPEAPSSPAAPRTAPEDPSSPAAPCAAPGPPVHYPQPVRVYQRRPALSPSSPAVPCAAPAPPARYAQPVRIYQCRPALSPAPAPPPPESPVPAPSSTPPAGPPPPAPPRHPCLTSRVEPAVYHPSALQRDPRHLHPIVTRQAAGVLWPAALSATAKEPGISPVPSSVHVALADPH